MAVNVAVLGPKDIVDRIVELGEDYKILNLTPYAYKNEMETLTIVNKLEKNGHMILFSGPIPYDIARKNIDRDLPMLYVSYSGSAIYKALFYYFKETGWNNNRMLRFSIDTIHRKDVEEVLRELEITNYDLYNIESKDGTSAGKFVEFHNDLYRQGKTDLAISCLTSAYDELKEKQVPSYRIVPTMFSICEALRFTTIEARNLISKEAQLCVGVMQILNKQEMKNYAPSNYEQKRMNLVLSELFINFCEGVKASMKMENDDEYIFYATRGAIENVTNFYKRMPLMRDIEEHLAYKVCIGLGFGYSGNEAEKNSREALKHAIGYNKNTCFVIFEDGKVRGPLESGRTIEFYSKTEESKLLTLALKSNVSVMTLNKIMGIFTNGKACITANDIAEQLNITLRSARRILNGMVKSGVAISVGEEQPASRGRPRQIYRIQV